MSKRKLMDLFVGRERRQRRSRRVPLAGLTGLEPLDRRILPAVSATFFAADGVLSVGADPQDETDVSITITRDAAGNILVNNGAIAIQGGQPTVANTRQIFMNGGLGNDILNLDESNGALPAANISGGPGNDILVGGSGNDGISGDAGTDVIFLGAGDDTFQYFPGDGSDTVDGGTGRDTMTFIGSDFADQIDISAFGARVRLTDTPNGAILFDNLETVNIHARSGADTVTVNDLSGTAVTAININLAATIFGSDGDGQPDAVIINGTNGGDTIGVAAFDNGTRIAVGGLSPFVNITNPEGATDTLTVNALGGNDTVDASFLPADVIGLRVDGGAGNDTVLGTLDADGFESPAVGAGGFQYGPAGSPWTFAGGAGLAGNGSGFTAGNPNAPEGAQVGFLQGTGSFSQTVAGLAAGTYQLTFQAAQRGNFNQGGQDFQVLVDGAVVGTFRPGSANYAGVTTAAFTVAAGAHTITFAGLDSAGGDNTALIDNVQLTQPPAAAVPDAGFESPSVGAGTFGGFRYAPAGTPWTFVGSAGISGNGSGFTSGNPNAPEGAQVGFLQTTGSFSQTVAGLAAGTYRLTFQAAQRGNFNNGGQDFRVLVDGVAVGTFTPAGTGYASLTAAFTVAAGAHTITFAGLDSVGGDNTALIDNIQLTQ